MTKSASDAPAITSWPNAVPVCPASLSTATTIPNEVAARMIATSTGAPTSSTASKPSATIRARTSEIRKAVATTPRWRSSSASNAISRPARKNRNTNPIWANTSSGAVMSTRSSTTGPITIPATSSLTIGGTSGTGSRSTSSGAAVAAASARARSV